MVEPSDATAESTTDGAASDASPRLTYLLIDGENIDATLGTQILGRRPNPEERPRWDRLTAFMAQAWGQPVRGLFFLNAGQGMPIAFVQALRSMDYVPVPLSGPTSTKVVDVAIQRTLDALPDVDADVLLVSGDRDFVDHLSPLLDGRRRVGVLGFEEFRSAAYEPLRERGLALFDLEHDVDAFQTALPRLRVIPIEEFDPLRFLG